MRKKKKLTQSKMAEFLDYTNERQLQRIENGETGCTVDKLMEIAQILDTSTDYLLFGMEIQCNRQMSGMLEKRTAGEKAFIQKIAMTILENMELLV